MLAVTCVISATSSLLSWSLVLSPSIHYVAFLHLRHSVSFMWYIVPCLLHVVNRLFHFMCRGALKSPRRHLVSG
ncbi:hypothetical protein [Shigella phage ESh8]|nr:hypothetical protein [Shigella phage ESh8]